MKKLRAFPIEFLLALVIVGLLIYIAGPFLARASDLPDTNHPKFTKATLVGCFNLETGAVSQLYVISQSFSGTLQCARNETAVFEGHVVFSVVP